MANILLTTKCVRSCPYCFAKKHMEDYPPTDLLSWENLIYIIDFLKNSNEINIAFLGGEPTLHPEFIEYVRYAIGRDFHVSIFTSGIVNNSKLLKMNKYLSNIDPQKLSIICNVNSPSITKKTENRKLLEFLKCFGRYTTLSFNIYKYNFNIDFLLQLILKYGLIKHIRFGLAHPIPGLSKKTHLLQVKIYTKWLKLLFHLFQLCKA